MSKIYLAPSIWRALDVRTASAIYASIASAPDGEAVVWEPLWNDALIARSRSLLATKFMEEEHLRDADVMVIVDDDVVWNPEDFWKIVEGARETRSIYGGVYVTRSREAHLSSRLFPHTELNICATPQRRPLELEYLATGFWAVHRDVFEAMLGGTFKDADGLHSIHRCGKGADRGFWPFFATFTIEDEPGSFHYLSEDWAFCERARQLGFKVWMDQSIILQHMGLYPYTVADIPRPADPGLPSTGTDLVEFGAKDRKTGDELLDTLVDDIAEFAEETPGDIRRMLTTGTATMARLWSERGDQAEEDWYRREDVGLGYILDLAEWHLRGGMPGREIIDSLAGKRVLDYGAGIGTTALRALRAGVYVDVWEPNETMRKFIRHRASKHFADRSLAYWNGEPYGRYDAVLCWHVFEHVESPEATLDSILRLLKPDGVLITESDFHCDDGHPMHHTHPDWEGALASRGLVADGSVYRRALVPAGA